MQGNTLPVVDRGDSQFTDVDSGNASSERCKHRSFVDIHGPQFVVLLLPVDADLDAQRQVSELPGIVGPGDDQRTFPVSGTQQQVAVPDADGGGLERHAAPAFRSLRILRVHCAVRSAHTGTLHRVIEGVYHRVAAVRMQDLARIAGKQFLHHAAGQEDGLPVWTERGEAAALQAFLLS